MIHVIGHRSARGIHTKECPLESSSLSELSPDVSNIRSIKYSLFLPLRPLTHPVIQALTRRSFLILLRVHHAKINQIMSLKPPFSTPPKFDSDEAITIYVQNRLHLYRVKCVRDEPLYENG